MIDVEDLKVALNIGEADTQYDDLLEALEAAAVSFVETQTGRHFGEVSETTEVIQGNGTNRLRLPEALTEDGSITVVELTYVGDSGTEIDADDVDGYIVRGKDLIRKRGYYWSKSYEYEVTFERGYSEGDVPADIRQLVMDLVARKFNQRGKEGFRSETYGGYSYTYDDGAVTAIAGAEETIQAYRGAVI